MKPSYLRSASWATIPAAAIVLFSGCTNAVGEAGDDESDELASACAPQVPPALAVPPGNKLRFDYDAIGVQIYGCDATATGYGWVFRAPEANLYGKKGKLAATHYAGPTWQANDGSTVVGAKLAESPAPDATAIPWLLLGATSHAGQGRMTDVTYIQRLETTGGKAPTTGCDAAHVGDTARVGYTATYYFYEAHGKK
ncbi:MAG TPA: DUF3455 domain-containing protein [Polyangiaceae bacterium]|nr:DUF3455 domain-containing protein [Polyangiaceae bacterium]